MLTISANTRIFLASTPANQTLSLHRFCRAAFEIGEDRVVTVVKRAVFAAESVKDSVGVHADLLDFV
jgi:hypothetical protein